ncbi:MAG TPA: glycosyltransferase family 2 protein [Verrucomicrobiae bacterium]
MSRKESDAGPVLTGPDTARTPLPSSSASEVLSSRAMAGPVLPEHEIELGFEQRHRYVVYIFAFNERSLLTQLLDKFPPPQERNFDLMLGDDGSKDGTAAADLVAKYGIRGVTRLKRNGGLSQNIMVALRWLAGQKYQGVILMNGNNRDGPAAIPEFIRKLEQGYGYVQGSRFVAGGQHVNTPWTRYLAIRLLHAPLFSLASFKWMTDTTNGYRAFSMAVLNDPRVDAFQPEFVKYEIEQYLAWKAIRLGYRATEIGVSRIYPVGQFTSHIRPGLGWVSMFKPLIMLLFRRYR